MDLALAEAGQGLAAQELALDFLPGLACAAAYACGPSSAPSQPSGQGKEKEKEKTPREKDNKGPSPHHSSSHKDKASSDKASSSGRRAGNVKLAPVPSPELLGALADLTAHMRRFHTSQVGSTSRTRSYILSFHSLITDTHRRSYHCTHLLTRPPAHLFTPDLPTTHPSTHPPTHPYHQINPVIRALGRKRFSPLVFSLLDSMRAASSPSSLSSSSGPSAPSCAPDDESLEFLANALVVTVEEEAKVASYNTPYHCTLTSLSYPPFHLVPIHANHCLLTLSCCPCQARSMRDLPEPYYSLYLISPPHPAIVVVYLCGCLSMSRRAACGTCPSPTTPCPRSFSWAGPTSAKAGTAWTQRNQRMTY